MNLLWEGQSPEVFITKDNIINTQDSVDLDIEKMISKDNVMEEAAQGTSVQVAKAGMEANHYPKRRRSERLKKDICLTTMEKLERAGTKRNLEGNSSKSNSFAVLSMDEMILVTSGMGVIMENDDFDTFNLLNDLEHARNDLFQKQFEQKQTSQTEPVEMNQVKNSTLQLEWLQKESSEPEEFILVESRKKKRQNRKKKH